MPRFNVLYTFTMVCETRGLVIEAPDIETAEELADQAVKAGHLDYDKFVELGGDISLAGWDTCDGTDEGYQLNEVSEED